MYQPTAIIAANGHRVQKKQQSRQISREALLRRMWARHNQDGSATYG